MSRRAPRDDAGAFTLVALAGLLVAPGLTLWRLQGDLGALIGFALLPSCVSFSIYAWDKHRAERGGRRVAEMSLLLVDLLGGWPGGFLAQRWLRHKTGKVGFQLLFWLIVAGEELALLLWLAR